MDTLEKRLKHIGVAVVDGLEYTVGFGTAGNITTIHRHIGAPDEKWISISASTPRYKKLAAKIAVLATPAMVAQPAMSTVVNTTPLMKPQPAAVSDQGTARLFANFLRQIAGTDWSKKDLAELADAVESGARKVTFNPDY